MAFKKTKLFAAIWEGCNKLRGGMDSSQYKDYVLTILFVKYVSDKAGDPKSIITVPEGASFKDLLGFKSNPEIGEKINIALKSLAKANDLVGVVDIVDFDESAKLGTGQAKTDRLSSLLGVFEHPALDFAKHRAGKADILGDAYEFLMKKFATESGKSKGQFYTPAEVSILLSWFIGAHMAKQGETLYDPTCGSGSLLLRCYAEAFDSMGAELSVHGQEMDVSTYGLSRINMVIHGLIDAAITQGSTLAEPKFIKKPAVAAMEGLQEAKGQLQTFKYIVANPPFSDKNWTNGFDFANDPYNRFPFGLPPGKNGDYAFVQHILASLDADGKAAVVLPHGVLFRGNAEAKIRQGLIKKGWIKAIIGLPANLFFGTGIPACVLLLDKENAAARKGIYMIDASKGFIKDGSKNKLRPRDMRKIMDAFEAQATIEKFSKFIPLKDIEDNDYNLNIPRYIDSSEPEDIQDLEGHLKGGIPEKDIDAIDGLWKAAPTLRTELFKSIRAGYAELAIAKDGIKAKFDANKQVQNFKTSVDQALSTWRVNATASLSGFKQGDKPRLAINSISTDILSAFDHVPMIDRYGAFQKVMELWEGSMQDDLFIIQEDGWLACKTLDEFKSKPKVKGEKSEDQAESEFNLEIGSGKAKRRFQSEVIPPVLVAHRYFKQHVDTLSKKEVELSATEQAINDAIEDHGGEDGFLADYMEDGKWAPATPKTATSPKISSGQDRLLSLVKAKSEELGEALTTASELLANFDKAKTLKSEESAARQQLWQSVFDKILALNEAEIKQLIIEDKWLDSLAEQIKSESKHVLQKKISRIEELASRYEIKLDDLEKLRSKLATKNAENMKLLGF